MFADVFGQIKLLRTPVRSLIYLYWIYSFTSSLVVIFIQIVIFKMFLSVPVNIVAVMFTFTGTMIGFCLFGYLLSYYSLGAKRGFYYSFLSFAISILMLSQAKTIGTVYVSAFLYGLGGGFFWLTIHTYELTETKDEDRDFYSSVLSGGQKIIQIVGPLFATGIIWFSLYIPHVSSLTLLFVLTPLFYLLGLFCFKGINEYIPERIEFADVKHFILDKRNRIAQIYIAGSGMKHLIGNIIPPLVIFYILGTELHVGIYSTVVGILSVILVIALSRFRNKGNRIYLFGIAAVGISALCLLLGYNMTFLSLVIYTIGNTILTPIMNVSDHVIALQTIETIGRENKDFYSTMILRDFFLWVYRMIAGVALLIIVKFCTSNVQMLSIGLYFLALTTLLTFFGAKYLVGKLS